MDELDDLFKLGISDAKATLRAYAEGKTTKPVYTAAGIVLAHLDEMEARAEAIAERGSTHEVRHAARVILGNTPELS